MTTITRAAIILALAAGSALSSLTGCTPVAPLPSALVTGDDATVAALNIETDTVIGSMALPADGVPTGGPNRAVVFLKGRAAYLAGSEHQTHILRLAASGLSMHPDSPVRIPGEGVMLDMARQNPWLLVRRAGERPGIRILAAHNALDITLEAGSVSLASTFEQATVCDDGETVLLRQVAERRIRLFRMDAAGQLTDTGHALSLAAIPEWVSCAPGAAAGAVLLPIHTGASVLSFTINPSRGLTEVDSAAGHALVVGTPGPLSNALAFAADGTGLFIRSSLIGGGAQRGWVERFSFDPASAEIGASPAFSVATSASFTPGREQIGVHPDGARIYLPEFVLLDVSGDTVRVGKIRVVDATSGDPLATLDLPDMQTPVQVIVPH